MAGPSHMPEDVEHAMERLDLEKKHIVRVERVTLPLKFFGPAATSEERAEAVYPDADWIFVPLWSKGAAEGEPWDIISEQESRVRWAPLREYPTMSDMPRHDLRGFTPWDRHTVVRYHASACWGEECVLVTGILVMLATPRNMREHAKDVRRAATNLLEPMSIIRDIGQGDPTSPEGTEYNDARREVMHAILQYTDRPDILMTDKMQETAHAAREAIAREEVAPVVRDTLDMVDKLRSTVAGMRKAQDVSTDTDTDEEIR